MEPLEPRTATPKALVLSEEGGPNVGPALEVAYCWVLQRKSHLVVERARSQHEWYALVMLDPVQLTAAPRTFIVPRDHIAAAAWIGHMNWRTDPSARPGARNAGMDQARVCINIVEDYEDRWDLLGTDTAEVPIMLPPWYHELAADPRVGLSDEHPWKEELPEW